MNNKEKIFFIKRLSFLLEAHVPLVEALQTLETHTKKPRVRQLVQTLIADVASGKTLSWSAARFPNVFDTFSLGVISVGEASGALAPNLAYLAEELLKKQQLKRKLAGAFVYPAVVVVLTTSITAFLTLYLFPKIMPVFVSLRVKLPLSTRVMMGASSFLVQHGLALVLVVFAVGAGFTFWYLKSARLRFRVESLLLRTPLLGGFLKSYILSQTARALGLTLSAHLTLPDALALLGKSVASPAYRRAFSQTEVEVRDGKSFPETIAKEEFLFPELVVSMTRVGEKSGTLPQTLLYISAFYEHEVEESARALSSLIEPALMVTMGLLVGFIAISIITPMYGLTEHLHA